jgi:hypothetical protein
MATSMTMMMSSYFAGPGRVVILFADETDSVAGGGGFVVRRVSTAS